MNAEPRPRARAIAFYLPQFHPIPENDEWWGKGFTEWTNVASARRFYPGHYQPHVPAQLGFYDLRLPEVREEQAKLASAYGIEAFCYWHYWFGGQRLLERPFAEVLESGTPDFPFCVAWANESWTGIWHGAPNRVLMEQTYPGEDDFIAHFNALLPAFRDERYVRVDGRPLVYVYRPFNIPDATTFLKLWRRLAADAELPGLYFVAEATPVAGALDLGFDAYMHVPWADAIGRRPLLQKAYDRLLRQPRRVDYGRLTDALATLGDRANRLPCVVPNWDNTPRSGHRGVVVSGSRPERFATQVRDALAMLEHRPAEERLLFVKSWNEWAEGNHLEPDQRDGLGYLEALRDALYSGGQQ